MSYPQPDRRTSLRYPFKPARPLIALVGGTERRAASVQDISAGGACLLLDRRFDAGDRLRVSWLLPGLGGDREIEVTHVTELGPERYLVGGRFPRRLAPDELLRLLLASRTPTGPAAPPPPSAAPAPLARPANGLLPTATRARNDTLPVCA